MKDLILLKVGDSNIHCILHTHFALLRYFEFCVSLDVSLNTRKFNYKTFIYNTN